MNSLDLKEIRKKYNLTQEDISEITSTSVRTVKSWEYGERNISKSAEKLILAFCNENSPVHNVENKEDFERLSTEEKLSKLYSAQSISMQAFDGLSKIQERKIELLNEKVDLQNNLILNQLGKIEELKSIIENLVKGLKA